MNPLRIIMAFLASASIAYPTEKWEWLPNVNPQPTHAAYVDPDSEPAVEFDPQVVFREEGTLAASMSFGHITVNVDIAEADGLAARIAELLNDARSIFHAKPFGGDDEQNMVGSAWSESLWNRTRTRFQTSLRTYQETIKLFYLGLEEAARPEELLVKREPQEVKPIKLNAGPDKPLHPSAIPESMAKGPRIQAIPVELAADAPEQEEKKTLHNLVTQFSDFSFAEGSAVAEHPDQNGTLVRNKRFAISTGFVVVGGLLALFSVGGLAASNAVKITGIDAGSVSSEQAEFVVKSLQNHQEMIANLEAELAVAKDEIADLKLRGFQNNVAILATLHNLRASEITNSVIDEYTKVVNTLERGLRQLLDGRLDHALIPPSSMAKLVDRLKDKAEKAGLSLPISEVAEIYGLGCSFVATRPRKLTVVVHVPLTKPNAVMSIYKFLNLGYAIQGSNTSVSVAVEAPYIAVNNERTGFLLLNDLEDCLNLGSLRMCPGYNFQFKSFHKYCISSFFMSRKPEADKICTCNALPNQARVIQHTRTSFHVFHPLEATLAIDQCANATFNRRETFRGTRLVNLQEGCFGHNEDYQLSPLEELGLKLSTVRFTNTLSLPKILKGMTVRTLNELFPTPPLKETNIPDLVRQYEALPSATNPYTFSWPFHFPALFTSSFSFVTIAGIAVLLCFCRGHVARFLLSPGSAKGSSKGTVVNIASGQGGARSRVPRDESEIPLNDFMNTHESPDTRRRGRAGSFSGSMRDLAQQGFSRSQNAFGQLKRGVSNLALNRLRKSRNRTAADPPANANMQSYDSDYDRHSPPSSSRV
jgi:hypothetical protein